MSLLIGSCTRVTTTKGILQLTHTIYFGSTIAMVAVSRTYLLTAQPQSPICSQMLSPEVLADLE